MMENTVLDTIGRESVSSDSAYGDDDDDSARRLMTELTLKSGNDVCADCGEKRPEWASINLGVFLCIKCAGIHRRLSVNISKVRSIRLDSWTKEMVQNMAKVGNIRAKELYEAEVPPCWSPPNPHSRHMRLEQWIRAKYERKEFKKNSTPETISELAYTSGTKHGYLYKKMKKTEDWNRRWFVLSRDYLCYYKNYQDRTPKGEIALTHLNITLDGPGLEQHTNSMLIAYHDVKLRKTRNIFVYAENGKEMMDWYLAIRTAKIQLLQETFPSRPLEKIQEFVTRDFTHTGYLCKMPPDHSRWQKRFFVLDQGTLRYYQKPTDAFALGEIILSSSGQNPVFVDTNLPEKLQDTMYTFMLHKPGRQRGGFPLMAETADSMKKWMALLQEAISKAVEICDPSMISSEYEDDDLYASIDTVIPPSPN